MSVKTGADLRPIPLHAVRGLSLVLGQGCELFDEHGRRYLDLMTNYGVNILGHNHPDVTAVIAEQARKVLNAHQSFETPSRTAFLEALGTLLPLSLNRISFANSGAESVEAALKYARVASGKAGVIATHRSYHGRTLGALSVTSEAKYRDPYQPLLAGVKHVPFDDLQALEAAIDGTIGAVIVEPIQGEAGVRVPSDGYLGGVRWLCDSHGLLLIVDEVQTGFRTGAPLAFTAAGILPDILCLSKAIANGLPLGVTVTTEAVSEKIPKGSHGSTFAGGALACAAGAATLKVLADPALHEKVRSTGDHFRRRLEAVAGGNPLVREVRGRGLMLAIELKKTATPVVKALQEAGVLVIPSGPVVRFLPSVLISVEQVDEGIDALSRALSRA